MLCVMFTAQCLYTVCDDNEEAKQQLITDDTLNFLRSLAMLQHSNNGELLLRMLATGTCALKPWYLCTEAYSIHAPKSWYICTEGHSVCILKTTVHKLCTEGHRQYICAERYTRHVLAATTCVY